MYIECAVDSKLIQARKSYIFKKKFLKMYVQRVK